MRTPFPTVVTSILPTVLVGGSDGPDVAAIYEVLGCNTSCHMTVDSSDLSGRERAPRGLFSQRSLEQAVLSLMHSPLLA